MAFWNKDGNKNDDADQLTNSYMAMYVSSCQSYISALESSEYPTDNVSEDLLKQAYDELLFTILVVLFNNNAQALDDAQTLIVWLIRSRLTAEDGAITNEQIAAYLEGVNSAVNNNIWLHNEGYALESVALTALNMKVGSNKDALKPHVPAITAALKNCIEETQEAFGNPQGLHAVVAILKQ